MPDGGHSYYTDMFHGGKCWTYLSEELPRVMQSFFRFSTKQEDTFVAGPSMGGYCAMKLTLHCPEKFAATASLSGALDPQHLLKLMPARKTEFECMFGDLNQFCGSFNDLFAQTENAPCRSASLPAARKTVCIVIPLLFAIICRSSASRLLMTNAKALTTGGYGTARFRKWSAGCPGGKKIS